MNIPSPGKPVRGSHTGKPVMALLDLLGRRTCLRILWELRETSLTFRALQAAADTSPGVLNTRLSELRSAHIVETSDEGYRLTSQGKMLVTLMLPLNAWANSWEKRLPKEEKRI